MSREAKVGLLVLTALVVLAIGTFAVGERSNVFGLKSRYFIRFETVAGLATGNPVQLNGVTVGRVVEIVLPESIDEELLTVWISIDRRFAARVREDSRARIKTLGLLGDKFIELTSGSRESPMLPSHGEIQVAPATDVDRLIASGEDVVDNVLAISASLKTILGRMEAGQGILGELTTDTDAGRRAKESMLSILGSLERISAKIEGGEGTLAALINNPDLVDSMQAAVGHFRGILSQMETGDGAIASLLSDPGTRQQVEETIANLNRAADSFAVTAEELRGGEGLLRKLMTDKEFADDLSSDLRSMVHNLNLISERLERGDGTLGQIINDPQVYAAVNDILVGINESKFLRWLIRNRQKAGIKERYDEETGGETPTEPSPAAAESDSPGSSGR